MSIENLATRYPPNKSRCFGDKPGEELMAQYHDEEWGQPKYDDNALFELLSLEGAQAGLSWQTVLKKREGYRKAFRNFDPAMVAVMNDAQLDSQLKNSEIIRNRLKIRSVRKNAIAVVKIQQEFGTFSDFVWKYVDNTPIINKWKTHNQVPTSTPISEALSKDLKKAGFTFVGPTIVYAFMQACGMVQDHLASCPMAKR